MKLVPMSPCGFDRMYKEMEKSFPTDEIRPRENAKEILNQKEYCVYELVLHGTTVGYLTVWKLNGFYFAEHFVVCEEFRNCGYGGKGLAEAQKLLGAIVLEAEPPHTDIARRRLNFYKRNGFYINEFPYIQPSYRENGNEVELKILSYPYKLENYESAVKQIYKTVYGKEI